MIEGASSLVVPDRILLVGETRGTKQIPLAMAELVMAAVGPVRVGLDWPVGSRSALDAFFGGGALDLRVVPPPSLAVVEMLHALRARADTRAFAYADDDGARMAEHVLGAYDEDPHVAFVILADRTHACTLRGNAPFVPMGQHLSESAPVVAFDTSWRHGNAWSATGVQTLVGLDRGDAPFVRWFDRADERGYDGELYLVEVGASPPASS